MHSVMKVLCNTTRNNLDGALTLSKQSAAPRCWGCESSGTLEIRQPDGFRCFSPRRERPAPSHTTGASVRSETAHLYSDSSARQRAVSAVKGNVFRALYTIYCFLRSNNLSQVQYHFCAVTNALQEVMNHLDSNYTIRIYMSKYHKNTACPSNNSFIYRW